jgi:cold shock CspA family protein
MTANTIVINIFINVPNIYKLYKEMLLYYSIITESMSSDNSNEYGAFLGRVDWFDSRKGYGFVVNMTRGSSDSTDSTDSTESGVFVHYSDIVVNNEQNVYKKLHPGEYVSFDKGERDDKVVCLNVRGVNGGPLLTENTEYRYKVFRSRNHNYVQGEEEEVDEVNGEVEVEEDQDPESDQ